MDDASQVPSSVSTTCNIQVFLRIKPCNDERLCLESCLDPNSSDKVKYCGLGGEQRFQYDAIGGPDCPQEQVWNAIAQNITDQYLSGYNATVFAYGQTGSGKTFTMQGVDDNPGLIQRTFEFLFNQIIKESEYWTESSVKCTFVEIYNETVYDLLADEENAVKLLREDVKRGLVYIEGAREETLQSCDDALAIFRKGAQNRHVAETRMNRESSRSHSIFTLYLSRRRKSVNGLEEVLESRFNLVDLAGSERQHSTGTAGVRLKEAGNINKSLLALSNVINALSDSQANSQNKHVHYRDSKLTFLLRDSLGGNSRTAIVACVSPAWSCQGETLSTLRFAKRAKMITNRAIINQDMRGSVQDLQAEIRRLQALLVTEKPTGVSYDCGADQNDFVHKLLERVRGAEEIALLSTQKCQQVEELLRRKEQQLNSERLIVKFRDNTLNNLKSNLPLNFQEALEEVAELRRLLECPPEAIKLQSENTSLRLQLAGRLADNDGKFDVEYVRGLEDRLSQYTDISMSQIKLNELHDQKYVETDEDAMLGEMQAKINELAKENALHKEQMSFLQAKHHDELNALMARSRRLEDQLNESNSRLSQLSIEFEALKSSSQTDTSTIGKLQTELDKLVFKLTNAQHDNEILLNKLESSEGGGLLQELQSTKERLAELTAENSQLRHENDKLVQHHNTKQKLQYHVKIKQENNDLKAALLAAKEQIVVLNAQIHQCRSPH